MISDIAVHWKTVDQDGPPTHAPITGPGPEFKKIPGVESPWISCLVWWGSPDAPHGGVFDSCRWNVKEGKWELGDLSTRLFDHNFHQVLFYCDRMPHPDFTLIQPSPKFEFILYSTQIGETEGQPVMMTEAEAYLKNEQRGADLYRWVKHG